MVRQTGLVPAMRYRDVPGTVDWLCNAFGCTPLRYGFDADGRISSAEVLFGSSPIALGPVKGSAFDHLMVQPDRIGGVATQYNYLVVADADAHCARSRAAGAEIVIPPHDDGRGARLYACKDREGHLWTFGTYDPLDTQASRNNIPAWVSHAVRQARGYAAPTALAVSLVLALAGGLMIGYAREAHYALGKAEAARVQSERETKAAIAMLGDHEADVAEALQVSGDLAARLEAEHTLRTRAEVDAARAAAKAQSDLEAANRSLSEERSQREQAELAGQDARKELDDGRRDRDALAAALQEAEKALADERQDRESSDRQVRALSAALAAERSPVRSIELATVRSGLPGEMTSRVTTAASASVPQLWETYQDPKAAFSFKYPSEIFQPSAESPSQQGPAFVSRDGRAHLVVYGGDNVSGQSIEAYRRQLIAESFSEAKFDYVPLRKTWFVLSGREGDEMFYLRITFTCDGRTLHGWGLRYPMAERNVYDRIVEDIHRSYKYRNGACG
jgi:uncharacterized glyoxalase superfamily protein PhnB